MSDKLAVVRRRAATGDKGRESRSVGRLFGESKGPATWSSTVMPGRQETLIESDASEGKHRPTEDREQADPEAGSCGGTRGGTALVGAPRAQSRNGEVKTHSGLDPDTEATVAP